MVSMIGDWVGTRSTHIEHDADEFVGFGYKFVLLPIACDRAFRAIRLGRGTVACMVSSVLAVQA